MIKSKDKVKVITLCGSTKFKWEFEEAAERLSLNNYIVLMPHKFAHFSNVQISEMEELSLEKLHKQKIDISDAIMVINKDGYIGEATKAEIDYAKSKGKEVYYRYIHCNNDCAYVYDCYAKKVLPPFLMCCVPNYPECPCYCIEDK